MNTPTTDRADCAEMYVQCGVCGDDQVLPIDPPDGTAHTCTTCGAHLTTDTDSDDGRAWTILLERARNDADERGGR